MSNLLKENRVGLIKTAAVLTAAATVLSLSGVLSLTAFAAVPSDYGLVEGWTISAAGSDDPDIYIVNDWGYKRLFLNPVIFGFYGHLGGFAAVHGVSSATRDAFPTSGLFRVDGTEKVYGVESTGEDTAMLHWVNTSGAQAVADDANFFKKVFVINQNEFNWYSMGADYTSVNQVPNYSRVPGATPVPTGPLSVSLASDNQASRTITRNATGVEYLKFRVSGTGTLNTVTIKRLGPGVVGDFNNVYLYDGAKRLTSGKSFSSATGETTFLVNVAVSGMKDLAVVADMLTAGAAVGNVNYVQLGNVTATGGVSVSGTPLNGNNFSVSGATSGRMDVAKVGSLGDPKVGEVHAQLSEFKLTANTEGATVKRMTLINGGTLKAADLTNLKLKVSTGTTEWSGTSTSDGYVVFDLGSGHFIAKGGNAIFQVYGDLAGKKAETVILYFENAADLYAVGDQYGQGMNTNSGTANQGIDAFDSTTSTENHTLTLQGGVLTLVYSGPNATTIGTTASDATLLKYSMTAASNIEVKKTRWVLCVDTTGDGTYDAAAGETEWDELNDFKVWNEDTNSVVMGPKDGIAFDDVNNTTSCPDAATGAEEVFTDSLDLMGGQTYHFKVTADIDTSLGGTLTASGSIIKVALKDYSVGTGASGSVTEIKYSGTNTAVAGTDIIPRADVLSSALTLSSSALTLSLAGSPTDQTKIKGMKDVDAVGITFAAGQASALKVTQIKITGYAADTTTYAAGVESGGDSVSVANAVSKVQLYESETGTLVASSDKVTSNLLGTAGTGTMTFSNLAWNIPAGTSRTMLVRVDLSNNTASGTAGDLYAFDIAATADVTSLDVDSKTVNPGNQAVNGTTTPTQVLTVKNSGSMVLATAASSPVAGAVYWGQTNAPISKFRITSTDEAQFLEKLTFAASASNEDGSAGNVKNVILSYKNKAGSTITTSAPFGNAASVNFNWATTDANRPYVPKDSSLEIAVNADMKTKDEGATQTTGTTLDTNLIAFSLDLVDSYNGSMANGFRAVGEGSGTVIDGTGTNIKDVSGAYNQTVYRIFPKIEQVALSSPYSLTGTPTVFKFSIKAMGLETANLRFDNEHNGSGSIQFEVVASGDSAVNTGVSTTFSVLDETGTVINGPRSLRQATPGAADISQTAATPNYGTNPSLNASMSFNFFSQDIEIAGGETRTFSIRLNNPTQHYGNSGSTGRSADYFQVTLQDDQASLINWVGSYDGTTGSLDTPSATGVLRSLPIYGPTFQR